MKKTAVITGASRGIGYAIAKQLGMDGFNVALVDINDPLDYEENLSALTEAGIDYLYVRANICMKEEPSRIQKSSPVMGESMCWSTMLE